MPARFRRRERARFRLGSLNRRKQGRPPLWQFRPAAPGDPAVLAKRACYKAFSAVSFGARPAMPGVSIGPGLTTLTRILRSFKSNGRAACDKRDLSFKFS